MTIADRCKITTMRFSWIILVGCFLMSSPLRAANSSTEFDNRTKLCKRSIATALERMKPNLTNFTNLREIDDLVRVVPFLLPAAAALYETNRVHLTTGMCDEIFQILQANILAWQYPYSLSKLAEYQDLITKIHGDQINNSSPNNWVEINTPDFYTFADLKRENISAATIEFLNSEIEDYMPDALSHLLAHEIAHLVMRPSFYKELSPAASRITEAMADILGYSIASKSMKYRNNPIFLSPLLNLFSREKSQTNGGAMHPKTVCRLAYVYYKIDLASVVAKEDASKEAKQYWATVIKEAEEKTRLKNVNVGEIITNALASPACSEFHVVLKK